MIRNRLGASARGTPRVPSGGLPSPATGQEGDILQIINGQWTVIQPLLQRQQRLVASAILNAGNATIDFSNGARVFLALDVNITGTLTLVAPAGLTAQFVQHVTLMVEQGAGGQTINAYSANVLWPAGGAAPVLSVGAGEVDILAGIADGADSVIRMVPSLQFPS